MISQRVIGRLSQYRRGIQDLLAEGQTHVFSHQLADLAGATAAQVRQDMRVTGFSGSTTKGYDVKRLADCLARFLDAPAPQPVALVGVGNLGRAIMTFFAHRHRNLRIVAAFDVDPRKVDRTFGGATCYDISRAEDILQRLHIRVAILAVPAPEAQAVAERLVQAGVTGILNFAPVPLHLGDGIFIEPIDMTASLEKVAFFARGQWARVSAEA
ncbi:MAG: redox-sensing transcriptional repressor Rex [Planctomycetes bacterium]|nr:redox-sensing transcriptional repressor Rex [Planctomycetota bacterium]